MKLAIISDTHLGDKHCTLIEKKEDRFTAGPKYNDFKEACGTGNDYLILLGDILDFSVTSYQNAYNTGRAFFRMILRDKIADQIIYVPGNHDYDIWNIVENEANIIYQIKNGRIPRKFRMAVPGIIDDRKDSPNRDFTLPGVEKRKDGHYSYGGLFLDYITMEYDSEKDSLEGDESHFVFVYPNVYLVTDNESVLMTHGQYLDFYWSLLSKWAPIIFGSDLKIGSEMDIKEMVGINFPFNQLACSGVGQAGVLSDLISDLQFQIKRGDIKKSKEYLNNLDDYLDENVFVYNKWYQFIQEAFTDLVSNKIKDRILETIADQAEVRYNEQYFNLPEVKQRFFDYYNACLAEMKGLKETEEITIPEPDAFLFGHTHAPLSVEQPGEIVSSSGRPIKLYNTGGWLWKYQGYERSFKGAEVFRYETGKGVRSVRIR